MLINGYVYKFSFVLFLTDANWSLLTVVKSICLFISWKQVFTLMQ